MKSTTGALLTPAEVAAGGAELQQEHADLRDSVRALLADRNPEEAVRERAGRNGDFDRALWRDFGSDLGAAGLTIPIEFGGHGYGWVEQAITLQEAGRSLYGGPLLSTVGLAIPALLAIDDDGAKHELLPRIADCSLLATAALPPLGHEPAVTASGSGGDGTLSGTLTNVLDGASADVVLLAASDDHGGSLYLVRPGPGVTVRPLAGLDLARSHARLELDGAPAQRLSTGGGAQIMARVRDRAVLALVAEQLGVAERALEMSVEYAKTRVQFDRAIGSFQAIKHMCADMLVGVESVRALVEHAAWLADNRPDLLPAAAAAAKVRCCEVAGSITADAIHVHGGTGFTWEHPAHLYFRRARASEVLFGAPDQYRAELADRLAL
ncbi:acyl-CoA dehydrogenase family protein [Actinomadura physcomitrii]|uniref:acyl-CoA dehydrogenase family protein n=1 Tax=Actinomadura physcomitrii TaxID=2650748 RepID=UPI00136BC9C7|nr:acyl-CoA dehydrogenase family protein [Actinomadura physcomitrii]